MTNAAARRSLRPMCNLYRLNKPPEETARLFHAALGPVGNAGSGDIFPGYPGLVVARAPGTGALTLRSMAWGFPFQQKGKDGRQLKPRPVNNARADKLDSFLWRAGFQHRRCLIPLTAFAAGRSGHANQQLRPHGPQTITQAAPITKLSFDKSQVSL